MIADLCTDVYQFDWTLGSNTTVIQLYNLKSQRKENIEDVFKAGVDFVLNCFFLVSGCMTFIQLISLLVSLVNGMAWIGLDGWCKINCSNSLRISFIFRNAVYNLTAVGLKLNHVSIHIYFIVVIKTCEIVICLKSRLNHAMLK